DVGRIIALSRHPLAPADRLENQVVDFDRLPADAPWWAADAVICTLGTTMAKAGSKSALRRVDHDYQLAIARHARAARTLPDGLDNAGGDFDPLPADAPWWAADAVMCTLGTTMAKAGSKSAFRRVDHDYPLAIARHARAAGTLAFVRNSALGASVRSPFFYS